MSNVIFACSLDFIGHAWANDNARKARPSNSVDAVLLRRVGYAPRTNSITTCVPRETSPDDSIYSTRVMSFYILLCCNL